ncbi:CD209 antigen-like [Pseudoliparis swirei]|uniref:CD209 antigen-like n=1 Tax=Pseudoliparis swirei TaxID=2059687 RepID=UPI0024BD6D98|nr:CD209 antigen-like [Pseudoliparis swirei]
MSVEFRSSTVTNMDMDNSKVGYGRLLGEGSKLQYAAYALRNSPFRAATVVLGLLCVLLLAGVIGQSVHHQKVERDHRNELKAASDESDKQRENLRKVQSDVKKLETGRSQLEQRNEFLSKKRDQIQTNNNLLTGETEALKLSQNQLQASNAAFGKEIEGLKTSKNQLETNTNSLSAAKLLLQKQYDATLKRKNEIQAGYDAATRDKDNLQNRYNNVTRLKEHLQLRYNDLIGKVEHLQDRYNFSSSEKEKAQSSHQNLTISKEALQASYNLLITATDEMRASYATLAKEKDELEGGCNEAIAERDRLKVKNYNLTIERDAAQVEAEKLKKISPARKCPTGWTRFKYSCYFTSVGKSNWSLGREYCQNKGADLAIIKSEEEMGFINNLYISEKEVWIGLTDGGIEGQWKWVDGTPMTTTYWGKDQPNSFDGRNQDCVEFWHSKTGKGSWNDEICTIEQQFICEM